MLRSHQEILDELNATIEKLLQSFSILQQDASILDEAEVTLLKHTQESLLARFVHVRELAEEKDLQNHPSCQKLEEKVRSSPDLHPLLVETFRRQLQARPRIGRNRKRSLKQGKFADRCF